MMLSLLLTHGLDRKHTRAYKDVARLSDRQKLVSGQLTKCCCQRIQRLCIPLKQEKRFRCQWTVGHPDAFRRS